MTREAKVGMLTGLGVIVLIGVLLSNYLDPQTKLPGGGTLGGAGAGANAETNATGTMAPLPVGPAFRKEVISPAEGAGGVVAAPGMGDSTRYAMATGRAEPVSLVAGMDTSASGRAAQAGPVIQDPVAPIELGKVPANRVAPEGEPPVIMVSQETRVSGMATAAGPGIAGAGTVPTVRTTTYVIAAGDTLSKIAKKFYHDAGTPNIQKIVAANPGVLKDEHATLIQGRKLTIPVTAVAQARVSQPMTGGVVPMPGDGENVTHADVSQKGTTTAKKSGTYVVQQGDTLAKIARKLSPANASQMEKKLVALNGIKDPDSLSAGTKLKMPA